MGTAFSQLLTILFQRSFLSSLFLQLWSTASPLYPCSCVPVHCHHTCTVPAPLHVLSNDTESDSFSQDARCICPYYAFIKNTPHSSTLLSDNECAHTRENDYVLDRLEYARSVVTEVIKYFTEEWRHNTTSFCHVFQAITKAKIETAVCGYKEAEMHLCKVLGLVLHSDNGRSVFF